MPTTDKEFLVRAMAFEYELLKSSHQNFKLIVNLIQEQESDVFKVHLYRSYAQVIQHIYEFMKAQVAWQVSKRKSENNEEVERFIVTCLTTLAKKIPEEKHLKLNFQNFAKDLRIYRNKVSGHVLKQRFENYPLQEFYLNYNVYIVWLMKDAEQFWATDYEELADHFAIQDFANLFDFKM